MVVEEFLEGTCGYNNIANNEFNRKFRAERPNEVWLIDVTDLKVGYVIK
jgi:transposase InsO family protein